MIEINNYSFGYKRKLLFDNACLLIDKPGIYLVKGKNGSGKTTLFNYICKQYNCSYCSQDSYLLDCFTIKEHFELFKINLDILDRLGLNDKKDCYIDKLSDGERQRVAIVLALFSENSIILLDEPFANLDSSLCKKIVEIIKCIEGKIILITSHLDCFNNIDLAGIIRICNKKISCIKSKTEGGNLENKCPKHINKKQHILYYKRNIKDKIKMYVIYIMGILFLLAIFLVNNSFSKAINEDKNRSLEMNKYYLLDCNSKSDDGISIKKCTNPNDSVIKEYEYKYNYDYLLNYFYDRDDLFVIDNENVGLKDGRYPTSYLEAIGDDTYRLGDEIVINSNSLIAHDEIDIYKENLRLKIVGIAYDLHFYNQKGIYVDYQKWDDYFNSIILGNNNITIRDYYEYLDIDSYKYLLFSDLQYNDEFAEGKMFKYYKEIDAIKLKVTELSNTIAVFAITFVIYSAAKYQKKMLEKERKNIAFLRKNSFSLLDIFTLLFLGDFITTLVMSLPFAMFFDYTYVCYLILYFVSVGVIFTFSILREIHYDKN